MITLAGKLIKISPSKSRHVCPAVAEVFLNYKFTSFFPLTSLSLSSSAFGEFLAAILRKKVIFCYI